MKDPLLEFPGYALRRAANAAGAILSERLSAFGLRQADASALILIEANPGLTSSRLGEALGIQRANMVPFLNRLESERLVERVPIDGRTQGIHLTDEGRMRLADARGAIETFEAELIAMVPQEHRPHLLPALLAIWN
jgi:DNA-binding MarR family transcriptional regulator